MISHIKTLTHLRRGLLTGSKSLSVTAMSKELGVSAKDLNSKFIALKWLEKKGDELLLTSLGRSKGATLKKGQYGEYIAWSETLKAEIK